MEAGVLAAHPGARVVRQPMADGGEGTAHLLGVATGGRSLSWAARDPLDRPIEAEVVRLGPPGAWALDTAAASGLPRLAPAERDPLRATTHGTGLLLRELARRGATSVVLGVGGSATVDGGRGACEALGFRFLDAHRAPLAPGADLAALHTIGDAAVPPDVWRMGRGLHLACDVDTPLCGPRGAARVFAPQKGASPPVVARLEQSLERLAAVLQSRPGPCGPLTDIPRLPRGGAAGGLAATLHALLGAALESGAERVLHAAGYGAALREASVVIVGEGRMDAQTAHGKAPAVVARYAQQAGVPVLAVMGQPGQGVEALSFLEDWEAARPAGAPLPHTRAAARREVTLATTRLLRRWLRRS